VTIIPSITLRDLFPGQDFADCLRLNKKCQINLTILNMYKVPRSAIDLMSRMFEINPAKRITAHQALQHDFFHKDLNLPLDEKKEQKTMFQTSKMVEICKPLWRTEDFKDTALQGFQCDMLNFEGIP
jgi:serine/threonine protein kinase